MQKCPITVTVVHHQAKYDIRCYSYRQTTICRHCVGVLGLSVGACVFTWGSRIFRYNPLPDFPVTGTFSCRLNHYGIDNSRVYCPRMFDVHAQSSLLYNVLYNSMLELQQSWLYHVHCIVSRHVVPPVVGGFHSLLPSFHIYSQTCFTIIE